MSYRMTAGAFTALLVLSGCSADSPSGDEAERPTTDDTEGATPAPTLDVASIEPGPGGGNVERTYVAAGVPPELAGIVDMARQDLATRLATEADAITVLAVEEVVWADSSYGCPRTDMAYVPGDADGLRIVLGVGEAQHEYRLAGGLIPVYCDPVGGLPLATSPSSTVADAAPTTLAPDSTTSTGEPDGSEDDEVVPDVELIPDEEKGDTPTEGLNPPDE